MQRYSLFGALLRAPILHGDLFRDVGRNWKGIALGYLAVLLLISWFLVMLNAWASLRKFEQNEFPELVKDFPPITITNGVASSPVPQPHVISDPDTKQPIAVLDTTGVINSLDEADGAVALLTRDKLHVKQSSGETRIHNLSEIPSFKIDRQRLTGWMSQFTFWFLPFGWAGATLGSLIYRLIQGLIYAAIGLIFNSIFDARLTYPALMRLTFVSITPVIILDTIVWLVGAIIPFWPLMCFVMAMVCLGIAVRANRVPSGTGFPVDTYAPPQQQGYGYSGPYTPPPAP
jgi:hypothetical protein